MALDSSFYIVTKSIAMRGGDIQNRYITADGRYVVSGKYLKRIVLKGDEYLHGLEGVEPITENQALVLIAENGYRKGLIDNPTDEQPNSEEEASLIENSTLPSEASPEAENEETETINEE